VRRSDVRFTSESGLADRDRDVRFVPKADTHAPQHKGRLFDYLVDAVKPVQIQLTEGWVLGCSPVS
jgi:hypothetical protein